jgi:hypothetical protein
MLKRGRMKNRRPHQSTSLALLSLSSSETPRGFFLSVLSRVRRGRAWSAWLGSLFLYACTPAFAEGSALPPDKYEFISVVAGLSFLTLVLGLILLVVQLIRSFRPSPALHKQFAAIDHSHPEYVTRTECADLMRQSAAGDREIIAKLDNLDRKVSTGMSRAHARIDPIAEAVAATAKMLDNHLEDHRKAKAGN